MNLNEFTYDLLNHLFLTKDKDVIFEESKIVVDMFKKQYEKLPIMIFEQMNQILNTKNRDAMHMLILLGVLDCPLYLNYLCPKVNPCYFNPFSLRLKDEFKKLARGLDKHGMCCKQPSDQIYPSYVHFVYAMRSIYTSRWHYFGTWEDHFQQQYMQSKQQAA